MELSNLNEKQLEAVRRTEGPVLIVAGAGSGKTRVLTYRIAYLIEELGISPGSILAITFTNKAADEMKTRVRDLVGNLSRDMWVSTFHSACVRILRRHIEALGYTRDFAIYDGADQKTVVKDILSELHMEDDFEPRYVQSQISRAKDQLLTPEKYREKYGDLYDKGKIWEIYDRYQRRLKANNALDFDDLINKVIELFRREPEILEHYKKRFQYILVDEYQDTNRAQYELVRLLAGKNGNLCVVGDADQSIYKFRGADIRNILEFEKDYPKATVIKLEQNYRSTRRILRAANEVIKNNAGRKKKKLWTENVEGEKIRCHQAWNEHGEADYIVSAMEDHRRRENLAWRDFAVLYRMNAQSRVVEEAFRRNGIPYKVVGGQKFYERKEIKDVLAYLKLIQNPKDALSLFRIINAPKRGVGGRSVEKIKEEAERLGADAFDVLADGEALGLSGRAKTAVDAFHSLLSEFMASKEALAVSDLLEAVLERTGYLEELEVKGTVEARTRIENIEELVSAIREFEKRSDAPTLQAYLEDISLMSDIDALEETDDQAVLMTLHSAKGLEFSCVFMVGMEEGVFPGARAIGEESEMEEERRLCYVGITRARKHLHLVYARERTLYGRFCRNPVSRFLKDIPEELIDGQVSRETTLRPDAGFLDKSVQRFREEARKEKAPAVSASGLAPGTKVRHKAFGEGMVISVKGAGETAELTIAFDQKGVKKLMLGFAPLEVIQ